MNPTHDVPQRCRHHRRRSERSCRSCRTATAASHFPFTMTKSMTATASPPRRYRHAPADRHVSVVRCPRIPPFGVQAGGGERNRTDDLLLAKQALSRLSYTPQPGTGVHTAETGFGPLLKSARGMVGLGRLELPTSRLSGVRSNQLSYRPVLSACRSWFVAARMPRKGVSAAGTGARPCCKLLSDVEGIHRRRRAAFVRRSGISLRKRRNP